MSLDAITPLLSRRKPNNLEELRIVSCRIGGCITHGLIDALLDGSNLKKLGLVQANMSSLSFKGLCLYVKKSRSLRELDLSYNEIPMRLMSQLIEVIKSNRTLTNLDLSWNQIMDLDGSAVPSSLATKKQSKRKKTSGQFSQLSSKQVFK